MSLLGMGGEMREVGLGRFGGVGVHSGVGIFQCAASFGLKGEVTLEEEGCIAF